MSQAIQNGKSHQTLFLGNLSADAKLIKEIEQNSPIINCMINQTGSLSLGRCSQSTREIQTQAYPLPQNLYSGERGMVLGKLLLSAPVRVEATVVILLIQEIFQKQIQMIKDRDKSQSTFVVQKKYCDLTLYQSVIHLTHEQLIQKTNNKKGKTTFFKIQTTCQLQLNQLGSKSVTTSQTVFFTKKYRSVEEAVKANGKNTLIKDRPSAQEIAFYALQQKLEGWVQGNVQRLPPMFEMLSSFQQQKAVCNLKPVADMSGFSLVADQFSFLTTLSLEGHHLNSLPIGITKLTQLTVLSLDRNKLTELPLEMTKLTQLTELSLAGNNFTTFPECVLKLPLRLFFLDGNYIETIPPSISQLNRLENFGLKGNKLTSLPPEMKDLGVLKGLDLSNNSLSSCPGAIVDLPALTSLSLSGNWIRGLPEKISSLTSLTCLKIDSVGLQSFSQSMQSLTGLTTLSLKNNYINSLNYLPQFIQRLDLENTGLKECPEEVEQLTSLKIVSLKRNRITHFPTFTSTFICMVNLDDNELSTFPEVTLLKKLPALTILEFRNNKLTEFPEVATLSPRLRINLSGNPFKPAEVTDWHQRVTAPNWVGPSIELNPSSVSFF